MDFHVRTLNCQRGMTLSEVVIVMGVVAVITIPLAKFITSLTKGVTQATVETAGAVSLRGASVKLERDFMEMNQVDVSSPTFIQFRMDSHRLPGYSGVLDGDGDGLNNLRDPDNDNDVGTLSAPSIAWRYGDDLRDDDDDGDAQIDVQCRYYLSGRELLRDFNYNNAGWGLNVERLAKNMMVSAFRFDYFGSKNLPLGSAVDVGNDGTANTNDAGERDNIITSTEIDRCNAPVGHGDSDGQLDTDMERRYIVSIKVQMVDDTNNDGKEDFRYETELQPPLLPLKRAE